MAQLIRQVTYYLCRSRIFSLPGFAQAGERCSGFIVAILAVSCSAVAAAPPAHWVVSWGASPSPPPDAAQIRKAGFEFNNQTLREIVHLSIGGSAVRVRFSNSFGGQSLEIGSAHLALRTNDSAENPDFPPGLPRVGLDRTAGQEERLRALEDKLDRLQREIERLRRDK